MHTEPSESHCAASAMLCLVFCSYNAGTGQEVALAIQDYAAGSVTPRLEGGTNRLSRIHVMSFAPTIIAVPTISVSVAAHRSDLDSDPQNLPV